MSALIKENNAKDSTPINAQKNRIWCEEDSHHLFEYFTDFNEWIDGEEGLELRLKYNIEGLANPSKALFAGDRKAYDQTLKLYRENRILQVLSREVINDLCGDNHWYERNRGRFEQLVNRLMEGMVVPFVGAGLSVESGFPTWKQHLLQQGRTSGIDPALITALLQDGHYEQVIEEIEKKGYRDTFIQEIRDVFSKTGKVTSTLFRLTELFSDTIITTNYDYVIEQAYETGEKDRIQIIDCAHILENPIEGKITIVKLHGNVKTAGKCILSKRQYDEAYGIGAIDLSKPIPKLLSYHYRTSSLLFLGCSLNQDRTMQVFQAVKDEIGDVDRPQHFALEAMPKSEVELQKRNAYLLKFGITPIWFPNGSYEYIEHILKCAINELRYKLKKF